MTAEPVHESGGGSTGTVTDPLTRRQVSLLVAIIVAGFLLRGLFLSLALRSPGYVWVDPDDYVVHAMRLVARNGWHWTWAAVTVFIDGHRNALPPGYYVFLSLFGLFPGFPVTAQVAQIVLGSASVGLVFLLGRQVHSITTGLIASAAYAVWLPPILNVWSTSQETLYVPIVLGAFVLLGRAVIRDGPPLSFGTAGFVFGLAALTRSMPLFFVGPAALVHVASSANRRRAVVQAVVFLAGVAVPTAPYSLALSRHFDSVAIIDTHGSIHLDVAQAKDAPGIGESAGELVGAMQEDPGGFLAGVLERARTLFYVNGGRLLQLYLAAESKWEAFLLKVFVHLTTDVLLLASVILAPVGVAVCRERRVAVLWLLWAAVNVGVASLGGFGGARLRAPFEGLVIALAAVVLSGQWRPVGRAGLAAALAFTGIAGWGMLPQLSASLMAMADYGVMWASPSHNTGRMSGEAGFNVPVRRGVAEFTAMPVAGTGPAILRIRTQGGVKGALIDGPVPTPIDVPWPSAGLAYLEVSARTADGAPAPLQIAVCR